MASRSFLSTESPVADVRSSGQQPRHEATADTRCAIVLVVSQLGVGGAERHMVTLANHLSSRFDVTFVYLKRDETLLEQVHIERLRRIECLDARRGVQPSVARRLAAVICEQGADVVLCANSYTMAYTQLARLYSRRRLRVIEVYHTTLLETVGSRIVMAAVYMKLIKFASALVFVSDAQLRYWTSRGFATKRVQRIYNGVDTAHFDPLPFAASVEATRGGYGFAPDDLVVGICAVLRPEKAHGDLLRAVARARASGCAWKVLVIGDGPTRGALEAMIDELGLRDGVRVTGYLKDVRREVAACDAIALVSTTETFSIAALEAMAMGKPMVMSDVGGAREQVVPGENGWLFPVGDIEALSECLEQAADRSRLQRMGAAARARTRRLFSLEAMIDNYAGLIGALRADG